MLNNLFLKGCTRPVRGTELASACAAQRHAHAKSCVRTTQAPCAATLSVFNGKPPMRPHARQRQHCGRACHAYHLRAKGHRATIFISYILDTNILDTTPPGLHGQLGKLLPPGSAVQILLPPGSAVLSAAGLHASDCDDDLQLVRPALPLPLSAHGTDSIECP